MKIVDLLQNGEKNAINMAELAARVNLDERELRRVIFRERCNGEIILSSSAGYYLPSNKEELERYIKRTEARAKSAFRSLKEARRKLRALEV